jgi:hypothetical protein
VDTKQNYLNINLKGGRIIKIGGITASLAPLAVAIMLLSCAGTASAAPLAVNTAVCWTTTSGFADTCDSGDNMTIGGVTATNITTGTLKAGATTLGNTTTGTLSSGNATTGTLSAGNTTTGTLSAR